MSKQRNREEKIPVVPLYSGPVKVLAIPPFGASSNNGLWRAKDKPPVELVVADLVLAMYLSGLLGKIKARREMKRKYNCK